MADIKLNSKVVSFYGIASSFTPRMTSNNSFQSQPASTQYTIFLDGLISIFWTSRLETAGLIGDKKEPGDARIKRKILLIKTNWAQNQALHLNLAFLKTLSISSSSSFWLASSRAFFPKKTMSKPGLIWGRSSLIIWRNLLRARFLLTALLESLVEIKKPNRENWFLVG